MTDQQKPHRLYVAPAGTQPGAEGWTEVGEVTGVFFGSAGPDGEVVDVERAADLRGADDDRPVTEQRLNGQDRATLRWFTGQPTLQDWIDRDPADRGNVPPPVTIRADVPLRMAARLKAVQDAQTMIRYCPAAYIPELRP